MRSVAFHESREECPVQAKVPGSSFRIGLANPVDVEDGRVVPEWSVKAGEFSHCGARDVGRTATNLVSGQRWCHVL